MQGTLTTERLTRRFSGGGGVSGVDACFNAGELTCIVGPSGSGKTTLLRLLAGLEEADDGLIRWNGKVAEETLPRRSMVFQQPKLLPHMSVAANIALPMTIAERDRWSLIVGAVPAARYAAVAEVAALLRIERLLKRDVRALSGGEAQRVALARALCAKADVFLFDEPLAAVDERQRAEFASMLRDILYRAREERRVLIYVTHDIEEAFSLGDYVGVLIDGQLVQLDMATKVAAAPATPDVASFMSRGAIWTWDGVIATSVAGRVIKAKQGNAIVPLAQASTHLPESEVQVVVRGVRLTDDETIAVGRALSIEGVEPLLRVRVAIGDRSVALPLLHGSPTTGRFVFVEPDDVLVYSREGMAQ